MTTRIRTEIGKVKVESVDWGKSTVEQGWERSGLGLAQKVGQGPGVSPKTRSPRPPRLR